MLDQLFIRDLPLQTIIGTLPFERHQQQLLILDVGLFLDIKPASQHDALSHSIDYSHVARDLAHWAKECTPKLIETLAEHLSAQLFAAYPCQTITLTLRKPGALSNGIAGIEITRHRPRLTTP